MSRNEWKYVSDLKTDLAKDLPHISCFVGDLNQALLNLIVNAAHAIEAVRGGDAQKRGTITISTRAVGDQAEIRVADTGIGIASDDKAKVYDPFFTTKPVGKGTGQGLAIVYSVVVEKHGGTISFTTEEGRGTTFIILLPLR